MKCEAQGEWTDIPALDRMYMNRHRSHQVPEPSDIANCSLISLSSPFGSKGRRRADQRSTASPSGERQIAKESPITHLSGASVLVLCSICFSFLSWPSSSYDKKSRQGFVSQNSFARFFTLAAWVFGEPPFEG